MYDVVDCAGELKNFTSLLNSNGLCFYRQCALWGPWGWMNDVVDCCPCDCALWRRCGWVNGVVICGHPGVRAPFVRGTSQVNVATMGDAKNDAKSGVASFG